MEAEALRGGLEYLVFAGRRERGHGERLGARALEGIVADIAGDADFVLGFFIEGRKVVVADGPIVERAARESTVRGAHAEIFGLVAPSHGAIGERAATDTSGVVTVAAFTGKDNVAAAIQIQVDTRVTFVIGAGIIAEDGSTLVTKIVLAAIVGGVPAAALNKSDVEARFAEFLGDNSAPGSGSDHDDIYARQRHGRSSAFLREFVLVAAPDGNHRNAEYAPTDGVAISVVAGIAVEALHGVGDDHVEEGLQGCWKAVKEGGLLVEGEISECGVVCGEAGGVKGREAFAVSGLQLAEVADELGIDVVECAGPDGAGILVGGNDLIAKGFHGVGFGGGEKSPRTGAAAAGNHGGGSSDGCGDLQEAAAREGALFGHGWNLR
jgi:hypothetical protein